MVLAPLKKEKIVIKMGYKLKTHSGAAKRFKKTGSSIKSRSANRNHILTKQSTKRKRHNRGLNKISGTVLKMASKINKQVISMARVTKSLTAKSKHKKVLKATKGHYGARSRLYKTAKQSNIKSLQYAFRDRKNKRSFKVTLDFKNQCRLERIKCILFKINKWHEL